MLLLKKSKLSFTQLFYKDTRFVKANEKCVIGQTIAVWIKLWEVSLFVKMRCLKQFIYNISPVIQSASSDEISKLAVSFK